MAACKRIVRFRMVEMVALAMVLLILQMQQCLGCSRVIGRREYTRCQNLPSQGASIAYSYNKATRRLDVAFIGQAAGGGGGWVGWGVNPTGWGMAGSSALVAFQAHNGTNVLPFKLSPAAQAGQRLVCSPIDLNVLSRAAQIKGSTTTIWASLRLHPGQRTSINMVWNRGSSVLDFSPLPHSLLPQDLRGFASLDVAA